MSLFWHFLTRFLARVVDSRKLLHEAIAKVAPAGCAPNIIDLIVRPEKPKLSGHKRAMAEPITSLVGLDPSAVRLK